MSHSSLDEPKPVHSIPQVRRTTFHALLLPWFQRIAACWKKYAVYLHPRLGAAQQNSTVYLLLFNSVTPPTLAGWEETIYLS